MDLTTSVTIIVSTLVAVTGWFVGNRLSADRERASKRREVATSYLIDAYRLVAGATARPLGPLARSLEQAVEDIQLFGSAKQVQLAQQIIDEINESGARGGQLASWTPLITDFRDELRQELALEPNLVPVFHWRITVVPDEPG
jgi:hypothetical protein